jgi:hypothetical protein
MPVRCFAIHKKDGRHVARLAVDEGQGWDPAAPRKEAGMERFVHRQNLDNFRKQLAYTTDESQRQQILKLLAEEEEKDPTPPKAK